MTVKATIDNGTITALTVETPDETAGLGQKCSDAEFTSQFIGKAIPVELGKDVDAVSGATITSTVVVNALNSLAVLPEAGALETGKSYREKKAKPLFKKIVTVLRSVYRAYIDLSRRFNDIQKSYDRTWSKVNSLTARVEELWDENRALKDRIGDFKRVERALGSDVVETIVQREKRLEETQRMQNKGRKRKIDRGER